MAERYGAAMNQRPNNNDEYPRMNLRIPTLQAYPIIMPGRLPIAGMIYIDYEIVYVGESPVGRSTSARLRALSKSLLICMRRNISLASANISLDRRTLPRVRKTLA